MMKELLFAILLGALLGFGATGSFLTLRQNKNHSLPAPTPTTIPITSSTPQNLPTTAPPPPLETTSSSLVIDTPKDNSVIDMAKTELRGLTDPNNIVIVRTPLKTAQTNSDNNGSFSVDIELDSGVNPVLIVSINPKDNSQTSTQIYLTYSTAKL